MSSQPQPAGRVEAERKGLLTLQPNASYLFAIFSANNVAATHLLSLVRATTPSHLYLSESLRTSQRGIGYALGLDVPDVIWYQPGRWKIGAGSPNRPTELLLCPYPSGDNDPSSAVAGNSIDGLHAAISFHPVSGAIIIRSRSSKPLLYLDGGGTVQRGKDTHSHVLFMEHNRLQLGSYEFALDFVLRPKDYPNFQKQRDIVLEEAYGALPSRHLDLLPSQQHYLCRGIIVHRKLYENDYRSQYSGVYTRSAGTVAINMLKYTRETSDRVRDEVRRVQINSHEGLFGMIDCWCEHDESWPCVLRKPHSPCFPQDTETIFYTTPLSEDSFASFSWSRVVIQDRLSYFYQTLVGLQELHKSQVAHGSISPWTLSLPRIMATGLMAGISYYSEEKVSTGIWVAPEVADNVQQAPPTMQADIWSLATSWIHTFKPLQTIKVDRQAHQRILQWLDGHVDPKLGDLVRTMMAWRPDERPSAEEALAHPVWLFLRDKQKRKAREQGSSGEGTSPVAVERVGDSKARKNTEQSSAGKKVRIIVDDSETEKPRSIPSERMARMLSPAEDS
ncbi:hypothetical protein DHEL01_v211619 [Diaporthe helianthi]|uniref:Protein kinase domain-containing protein n=1 Tax=Diaporthe helianthi TaxID=158607 RepID=A0A2P5HIB6_DIAHE|nr:hypothetical protein DHEL01_v211619 [Diaporthe helianthi]